MYVHCTSEKFCLICRAVKQLLKCIRNMHRVVIITRLNLQECFKNFFILLGFLRGSIPLPLIDKRSTRITDLVLKTYHVLYLAYYCAMQV